MAHPAQTPRARAGASLEQRTLRARLGLLLAALLVPIMVVLHAPLVAAIVPSAVLTIASIQALERVEAASVPVITPELVDPRDPVERARILHAIPVPDTSRTVA